MTRWRSQQPHRSEGHRSERSRGDSSLREWRQDEEPLREAKEQVPPHLSSIAVLLTKVILGERDRGVPE